VSTVNKNSIQYEPDERPPYAFCEKSSASGLSRWHIRKLDEAGLKLGGGITTKSLCERVERGWDLKVRIRPEMLDENQEIACRGCLAIYKRETGT
jgi:hypothetical protein